MRVAGIRRVSGSALATFLLLTTPVFAGSRCDFPALGASSREASFTPEISVVIPVKNGGQAFEKALKALLRSTKKEVEIIVVDDGSTDGSGDLAKRYGARVVRLPESRGPAEARNVGARLAKAPLLAFVDADVAINENALALAKGRFDSDPSLSALFGSYDSAPDAPSWVSQFRNLLHHYTHQQGNFVNNARPAHTFWSGLGMIKASAFAQMGGFDSQRYPKPSIEDIDLGYRLTQAGHPIVLARDVQGKHLKEWTFLNAFKTDVFQRGIPWMELMARYQVPETDLNLGRKQKLSVVASGLVPLGVLASPLSPLALTLVPLGISGNLALNHRFYTFLARTKSPSFAAASVPLHLSYFWACGAAFAIGKSLQVKSLLLGDGDSAP